MPREAVSGIWRSPLPDGTYVIPTSATSALSSPSGVATPRFGTASTSQLDHLDLEKGLSGTVGDFATLPKEGGSAIRQVKLAPGYNPPRRTVYHYAPILRLFRPILSLFERREKVRKSPIATNLPLEIHLHLSGYLSTLMQRGTIPTTLVSIFFASLNSLADSCVQLSRWSLFGRVHLTLCTRHRLGTMERVLSTPLPFAYLIHCASASRGFPAEAWALTDPHSSTSAVRATAYIYLVLLPFLLYASLAWLTIPAVFSASGCHITGADRTLTPPSFPVSACVFLGFLELGQQLEMPFGYDESDLDLDRYAALIAAELQEIAAHAPPSPATFVFSPLNTPFQPFDRRSAPEILASFSQSHGGTDQAGVKGVPGMRHFLAKHWHELEDRAARDRSAHKKRGVGATWATADEAARTVHVCALK